MRIHSRWLYTICFFTLLLLGAALRLGALDRVPSGFHRDEVANAYIGKYILTNGVDLYGHRWPIWYVDKHGDYPPVVPMYISGMSSFIFGDTIFAARLPGALAGIWVCVSILFIARQLGLTRWGQMVVFAVSVVMPWQVSFSRTSSEGMIALAVFATGLWCILKGIYTHRHSYLWVGSLLWGMTYLLYPSYRIFVPLLMGWLTVWSQRYRLPTGLTRWFAVMAILTFAATLLIARTPWGAGRYTQTSIMSAYAEGKNPQTLYSNTDTNGYRNRIFNNKLTYLIPAFVREYTSYWSPGFLFTHESVPPWFAIPRIATVTWGTGCLLILALLAIGRLRPDRYFVLLVGLLALSPVASSLTSEHTPHAHRALMMSLGVALLTGYGWQSLSHYPSIWRRILRSVWIILFVGELCWFSYNYFVQMSPHTAIVRDDGLLQTAQYIHTTHTRHPQVYVYSSSWFPMYYLYAAGGYERGLAGRFTTNLSLDRYENIIFKNGIDCPLMTDLAESRIESGSLFLFHKDCMKDGVDPRFTPLGVISGIESRHSVFGRYIYTPLKQPVATSR